MCPYQTMLNCGWLGLVISSFLLQGKMKTIFSKLGCSQQLNGKSFWLDYRFLLGQRRKKCFNLLGICSNSTTWRWLIFVHNKDYFCSSMVNLAKDLNHKIWKINKFYQTTHLLTYANISKVQPKWIATTLWYKLGLMDPN